MIKGNDEFATAKKHEQQLEAQGLCVRCCCSNGGKWKFSQCQEHCPELPKANDPRYRDAKETDPAVVARMQCSELCILKHTGIYVRPDTDIQYDNTVIESK
ncbi:MAG: hypothetical protein Q7S28_02385 [bacterium]|nr:hypothetical protein [bacterium]